MSYRTEENFRSSVGSRVSRRGDGAWPGGEGGWLETWNKETGAWGGSLRAWGAGAWRGPRGWGRGGVDPQVWDGRSDVRSLVWMDGNSPLCSIGHHPLRVRCPKDLCSDTLSGNHEDEDRDARHCHLIPSRKVA